MSEVKTNFIYKGIYYSILPELPNSDLQLHLSCDLKILNL